MVKLLKELGVGGEQEMRHTTGQRQNWVPFLRSKGADLKFFHFHIIFVTRMSSTVVTSLIYSKGPGGP